jgi:hypothetical protein
MSNLARSPSVASLDIECPVSQINKKKIFCTVKFRFAQTRTIVRVFCNATTRSAQTASSKWSKRRTTAA